MKYLKLYENYTSDKINPIDYFPEIVDLLKHKGRNISDISIDNDALFLADKEIKLDKYGNVMLSGRVLKTIGSIKLKPSVDLNGDIKNFSFQDNIYDDGSSIELGDNVIVDDKYHGIVDGFSDGEIMIEDQDGEINYVSPSQLKKYIRQDPSKLSDFEDDEDLY